MIITSPVRKALLADKDEVLDICAQDHAENGQFSYAPDKVERTVNKILADNEGVIGIIRRKADIEAIMILEIGQMWYTDDWCLKETINYVRPRYRRSTNAKDMISFGKRCALEIGLPLMVGVVSNERTAAKMELYRRELGEARGGYFIYNMTLPTRSLAIG